MLLAIALQSSALGSLAFLFFINGWIPVSVGFNVSLAERVPAESQGAALGLATGLMSVAVILGSALGGIVTQRLGYNIMLVSASGLLVAALAISLRMRRPEQLPWVTGESMPRPAD